MCFVTGLPDCQTGRLLVGDYSYSEPKNVLIDLPSGSVTQLPGLAGQTIYLATAAPGNILYFTNLHKSVTYEKQVYRFDVSQPNTAPTLVANLDDFTQTVAADDDLQKLFVVVTTRIVQVSYAGTGVQDVVTGVGDRVEGLAVDSSNKY